MKTIYHYCSQCKIEWLHIPKTAKLQNEGDKLDGFYFNCNCKSTVFLPLMKVMQLAGLANNQALLDRIKESFL